MDKGVFCLFQNYLAVIETPMDLGTVGSKLSSSRYASPVEFAEDVRLIFHNSRSFNTNKRSRVRHRLGCSSVALMCMAPTKCTMYASV